MKKIFFLLSIALLLFLSIPVIQYFSLGTPLPYFPGPTATVNNQTFSLLIAKTAEEKAVGLSNHSSLPKNQGMLFPFDTPDYHGFWMKHMKFPIDILFLRDGKIVTIYDNVQPANPQEENPPVYTPDEPANAVLEINAGLAQQYGMKKGDTVTVSP